MMTSAKLNPDVRVRKLMGYWCVQRRIHESGLALWSYVGAFDAWSTAFAVAEVEASPDEWPFYMEACS